MMASLKVFDQQRVVNSVMGPQVVTFGRTAQVSFALEKRIGAPKSAHRASAHQEGCDGSVRRRRVRGAAVSDRLRNRRPESRPLHRPTKRLRGGEDLCRRRPLRLGEYLLPYAIRRVTDPEASLIVFLESTYRAAADLADWDSAGLECAFGQPLRPRAPQVLCRADVRNGKSVLRP
ncbi:DUF5996 family protein [Mesorhizobium sp. M0998]|uniref:DUF5996 family protein n=2 Tax=unclassified Mesorhizobium TaxID=325217 RepID=UPI003334B773